MATGGGGDSAGAGVREGSATSKTKLSEVSTYVDVASASKNGPGWIILGE